MCGNNFDDIIIIKNDIAAEIIVLGEVWKGFHSLVEYSIVGVVFSSSLGVYHVTGITKVEADFFIWKKLFKLSLSLSAYGLQSHILEVFL